MLDNTLNQTTIFRTKNWVEINDKSPGKYNDNIHFQYKTSVIRSSLCAYSDAYIHVKGTISIKRVVAPAATSNDVKEVVTKNCDRLPDCLKWNKQYTSR